MAKYRINKEKLDAIAVDCTEEVKEFRMKMKEEALMRKASVAIVAKIAKAMQLRGMKNQDLAKALNVSASNITRLLSGSANFQLSTLVQLEKELGITLIDREDNVKSKNNGSFVKVIIIPQENRPKISNPIPANQTTDFSPILRNAKFSEIEGINCMEFYG